jgi:hypothetical protein
MLVAWVSGDEVLHVKEASDSGTFEDDWSAMAVDYVCTRHTQEGMLVCV